MPTVLILDGELSRRQHLVKLITNIDPQIHIETFVKAEAALAWLHWHPADLVVSDVPDQMAEFVADLDIADDGIGARLLADEIADLFDLVRIDHFADPDIEECALEQRTHVRTLISEDHPDVV